MFTLDQARAFVAVAEELHFGRAAELLHMTQPPLSRQIQKLEKILGVQLLLRQPRGVALTPAGKAFLDECRQLLAKVEGAPRRAQLIASGQIGLVRLGYTAASAYSVLGELLKQIKTHAPGVTVELHEMVSARQLEALHSGSLDIGLARPPFHLEGVESSLLCVESLVVAVPADHHLAKRGAPITAQELEQEPLIMHSYEQARYFRDLVTGLIDVRDGMVSHTVSQVLTMVSLAAAGQGLALVPESAGRFAMSGVRMLPLKDSPEDLVQLHAVWTSTSMNPALDSIISALHHVQTNT